MTTGAGASKIPAPDLCLFGLMRGGHNAVANWLVEAMVRSDRAVLRLDDAILGDHGLGFACPTHGPCQVGIRGEAPLRLAVFDDYPRGYPFTPEHLAARLDLDGRPSVLVLRDPWNTFASRLKMALDPAGGWRPDAGAWDPLDTATWCAWAREAAGKTRHLDRRLVVVPYNLWLNAAAIREQVLGLLDIDAPDRGVGPLSRFGGGSSFEAHGHVPGIIALENRWRWAVGRADYRQRVLEDPEVRRLGTRLFPAVAEEVYGG